MLSQKSIVQELKSLQLISGYKHNPLAQESFVQGSLSFGQRGGLVQAPVLSQIFAVHGSPSEQFTGV